MPGTFKGMGPSHPSLTIKVISHTGMIYWWPVWVLGFILAGLTYAEGTRLAVVPSGTTVREIQPGKVFEMTVPDQPAPSLAGAAAVTAKGEEASTWAGGGRSSTTWEGCTSRSPWRVTSSRRSSCWCCGWHPVGRPAKALYFSFCTLTTVGYGDITPVSNVARMLAMMEATTGMFYVTVLIARLVALYSSGCNSPSALRTSCAGKELRLGFVVAKAPWR